MRNARAPAGVVVVRPARRRRLGTTSSASFQSGVISRVKAERTRLAVDAAARDVRGHAARLRRPGRHRGGARLRDHDAEHDASAADERPGSLAGVVSALAAKAASAVAAAPLPAMPVIVDARMLTSSASGPRGRCRFRPDAARAGVFAARGRDARRTRRRNVELLHTRSGEPVAPDTVEARVFRPLVGAVARARFEPASVDGLPVAPTSC